MGFTGAKDSSNGFVKRVASSFSNMRKKKNTNTVDAKGLPRSKSTGANFESMRLPAKKAVDLSNKIRTKSACVSPQPRREKIDGHEKKNFDNWKCFDDSDSIWLSSDCASPTSFLEEHRLSVSFHFSVDERVVSWLSNLANSSSSLNLGASSIKERRRNKLEKSVCRSSKETAGNTQMEASKEGKINPVGKNGMKQSMLCPEGIKTHAKKLSETALNSSSQVTEEKRVSFSAAPCRKLASENSSSLSDSTIKTDDHNTSAESSMVDGKCLEQEGSKIVDSKKKNIVEPLFWPFEQIFDWTPEDILKHFSMSPRRKKSLGGKTTAGTSPRSMRQQLHTRKLDFKEGCKRKLIFNDPVPKDSRIPELKRTISNSKSSSKKGDIIKNGIKRNKSLPSRLRNSSKMSSKVVPIEVTEEAAEADKDKRATQKLVGRKSRTFIEDDFAFIGDWSIEKVVGLGEFNGREGIDSDFNGEIFLLDDSLCEGRQNL